VALIFHSNVASPAPWIAALQALMPDLEIRVWPEIGDPADAEVMLAWLPPRGSLARLPNLKLLQCMGAGVDQLLADESIPPGLPVARLVNDNQTAGMTEYVLAAVLRYHRRLDEYARFQRDRHWERLPHVDACDRCIGVMGLGDLGRAVADKLALLGFPLVGWSRHPKELAGIDTFHGPDGLQLFLPRCEILVCLLPFTPSTADILRRDLFDRLPRGAHLINAGRGPLLVEEDLLRALDDGRIAGATLDVFRREPLSVDDLLWAHPKLTITPHIATIVTPQSTAPQIVENIRRVRAGLPPRHLIDRSVGY